MTWILSRFNFIAFLSLLAAMHGSFFTGKTIGFNEASDCQRQLSNGSILCKSGPWGDLSYTLFTIGAQQATLTGEPACIHCWS